MLITKELAPIFRGREDELKDNFSMLISVLDGKGFTSDTGMRGQRGYDRPILFNWIGATTPLPAATHRLMSQLGTRLLFFEVPVVELTEEQLLAYALADSARLAETECRAAVNDFLDAFYSRHPVGSISAEQIEFPKPLMRYLVRLAQLLVKGRAEVRFERSATDPNPQPVAVGQPEGPFKVVNYFKDLARGHALIHGRMEVTEADLALCREVALSSLPGHIRPIIRELCRSGSIDTGLAARLCQTSAPTARSRLKEVAMLGFGTLAEGSPKTNQSDRINLDDSYAWLRSNFENEV